MANLTESGLPVVSKETLGALSQTASDPDTFQPTIEEIWNENPEIATWIIFEATQFPEGERELVMHSMIVTYALLQNQAENNKLMDFVD